MNKDLLPLLNLLNNLIEKDTDMVANNVEGHFCTKTLTLTCHRSSFCTSTTLLHPESTDMYFKRTNNNSTRVKSWVFYLHRYNWWNGPPLITELADLFHLRTFDIDYIILKNFCFFTHQTEKSRSQSRKVSSSWSCKGAGTPSNPSRPSPIWNSCSARTLAWFGHLDRIWHNADLMFCLIWGGLICTWSPFPISSQILL